MQLFCTCLWAFWSVDGEASAASEALFHVLILTLLNLIYNLEHASKPLRLLRSWRQWERYKCEHLGNTTPCWEAPCPPLLSSTCLGTFLHFWVILPVLRDSLNLNALPVPLSRQVFFRASKSMETNSCFYKLFENLEAKRDLRSQEAPRGSKSLPKRPQEALR